jgi:hypothetical protein
MKDIPFRPPQLRGLFPAISDKNTAEEQTWEVRMTLEALIWGPEMMYSNRI